MAMYSNRERLMTKPAGAFPSGTLTGRPRTGGGVGLASALSSFGTGGARKPRRRAGSPQRKKLHAYGSPEYWAKRGGRGATGGGGGPTSTTRSTQTTKAARSPELEALMQGYMDRLGGIRTGMEDAYGGVSNALLDMMKYVADATRTQGSAAATSTGQAALASGLSPLEATALSGQQWQGALQSLYPQLAQMRVQRAQVPVQMNQALAQLLTGAELPMTGQVAAPYFRDVAGRTTTGQQEVTDFLGRERLAAQMQQAAEALGLEREKMDLSMEQAQQAAGLDAQKLALQQYLGELQAQTALQQAQIGLQGRLGAAEMGLQGRLGAAEIGAGARQAGAQSDLMKMILQQQMMGEREAAGFEREMPLELMKMAQEMGISQADIQGALDQARMELNLKGIQEERMFGREAELQKQIEALKLSMKQSPEVQAELDAISDLMKTGKAGKTHLPHGTTVEYDVPGWLGSKLGQVPETRTYETPVPKQGFIEGMAGLTPLAMAVSGMGTMNPLSMYMMYNQVLPKAWDYASGFLNDRS